MTDNFLDDQLSTASAATDTFLQEQIKGMDFTSANEIATATVGLTGGDNFASQHDNIVNELVSSGSSTSVGLTGGDNLASQHDNIVNELVSSGSSTSVDALRQTIRTSKQDALQQSITSKLVDVDTPLEEKNRLTQLLSAAHEEQIYSNVNLEREMLQTYSTNEVAMAKTQRDAEVAAMWSTDIDTYADNNSKINLSVEEAQNQIAMGTTNLSVFGDVLKVLIPLEYGIFAKEIADKFFNTNTGVLKVLAPGEYRAKFQTHFDSLPPEKQLSEVQRFLEVVQNSEGFFGSNAIEKINLIEGALNGFIGDRNPTDFKWGRLFENIFGIVDAAYVGKVLKNGVRGMFNAARTSGTLAKLEPVAPKLAEPLVAQTITSPEVAAKVGVTPESSYISHLLTATDDTVVTKITSDTKTIQALQNNKEAFESAEELFANQNSTYAFTTPAVKNQQLERLIDGLSDIKEATLYTNYTVAGDPVYKVGADGAVFQGIYGNADRGYSSWAEAVGISKRNFPNDTAKVLVASPETGGVIKYLDEVPSITKGEYFFEIKRSTYWDELPEVFELGRVTQLGGMTNHILDYQTILSRRALDVVNVMLDKGDLARNKLFHIFKPVNKFVEKDEKHLHALVQALSDTTEKGRLSSSQLNSLGLSTEEAQKAYHSWLDTTDVMHILDNSRTRSGIIRDGYTKEIFHADTEFSHFGKVFDTIPTEDITTVYDPIHKVFKNVTKDELTTLYSKGHRVAKTKDLIERVVRGEGKRAAAQGTNYVLLEKGSGVLAKELPSTVLGYIPGWFRKNYTDMYFITETLEDAVVNGKKVGRTRVIHSAANKGDADKAVAKLREANEDGVKYDWQHDRKLTNEQREFYQHSLNSERGTYLRHRGKGLSSVDSLLGNEHGIEKIASDIQHPMKAMETSILTTSRLGMHDKGMSFLKSGWENQFGEFAPNGKFPLHEGFIQGPLSTKFKQAKAAYRTIDRLDAVQDKVGAAVRRSMVALSEKMSDWGFPKISEAALSAKDINLPATARSVNFFRLIAAEPIKQWITQTSQILFTAGIAPKYFLTSMAREMSAAHFGLLLKNMPEKSLLRHTPGLSMGTLAKHFGTSEKEFVAVLDSIEKSGILYVDSHAFLKNVSYGNLSDLYNSSLEKKAMGIVNNLKRVNKMFTNAGFNPAEKMNMLGHWLIARDRVVKRSPELLAGSRAFTDAIGAEARGISLGMKHSFAYADNQFTALATQFMSFQHKAWLSIVGNNKYFSPSDRVGLVLTQSLLWGTAGLGLKGAFDKLVAKNGVDKDQQTQMIKEAIEVAQSGLFDKMISTLLDKAGLDDIKVDWAGKFSVFNVQQNNLVKTALAIFGGEKQIGLDIFFGPTAGTGAAIQDMFGTMALLYQTHDMDDESFWTSQIKNTFSILPVVSRQLQWQVARNTGLLPNAKGTYFNKVTQREAALFALTGLGNEERTAYFDIMDLTTGGYKKSMESDAKTIYERLSKDAILLNAGDLTPDLYQIYDKKLKASLQYVGTVLSKADPFYRVGIEKELGKLIKRDPKLGKDSFLYNMSKFYSNFTQDGAQSLYQLQYIKNKSDELQLDAKERQAIDSIITYYKESLEAFSHTNVPQENE
jgi:hypothetical protein